MQPGAEALRVSVVIPCFNYAEFLPACVSSALDQRDVIVDITIVDDASTDDSARIAEQIAASEPRVRVVRHTKNEGHLRTANEALRSATADYLVKLDADDLLTPGSLARSAALLTARPDVGFVYGRPEEFSGRPPVVQDGEASSWTVWPGQLWVRKVLRRAHNVIMQPEVMMRRAALLDVGGGYSYELPLAEDYHLWLRLATRWSVGRVNGCTQGLYRVHGRSLQRSASDLHLADLRGRVKSTRLFLEQTTAAHAELSRHALGSLARDTRRLLAQRRGEDAVDPAVLEEYEQIARQLELDAAIGPTSSPLTWKGPAGRALRRVHDSWRWRRWQRTGV